jgi:hypothetical protein
MLRTEFAALAFILAAGAGVMSAQGQSSSGSAKTLYKWVDENGEVHYGDSVPPQYAKQERHVLNERGVEVGKLEAEKTDAQRAAEEALRQAATNARQRDQILLTTYVSAEQIEQLRDQRLDLIEGQVKVTSQYLDSLRGRLKNLETQAQLFRPYSTKSGTGPLPDQLAEDLVRTASDIRAQERNLAGKRTEEATLREQFQSDIERYKQLTGGGKN